MAPKSSAKKAATPSVTSAAERRQAAQEKRALQAKAEREALTSWIDEHDALLDKAADAPVRMEELFSAKLEHRTFAAPGLGEQPYDWSEFRAVLESRTASSPRWFMQLREEDLLAGADGLEGVTVDCYVIAEATQPTVAPGEYIVKVHWPYSDAEDNAPERILPLAGQGMCWRRVVKADGSDMNVFLLQKRSSGSGAGGAAPVTSAAFGFGAPAAAGSAPPAAAPAAPAGFGVGFGGAPAAPAPVPAAAAPSFGLGFGSAAPAAPAASAPGNAPGFGFSFGPSAPAPSSASPASAPAFGGFSFGSAPAPSSSANTSAAAPAFTAAAAAAPAAAEETGEVKVQPLKTSEVLFALWSRKRLTDLAKEIRSGSRIVREGFALDASTKVKLVMQNDRKDDVAVTVRRLLLNRLFAKQDDDVKAIDAWIGECPVYDEALTTALQAFRERQLEELADESDLFKSLSEKYHAKMEAELRRIVAVREAAANTELERIDAILTQMKEHKLAEKSSFRLLKFYAKNDVCKFRPFGKISGVSEMGESVDVCVPPAHVNINPFTGKPI